MAEGGVERIVHGNESDNRPWYVAPDGTEQCPDCGADPGELHEAGCDVEQCPTCETQRIGCRCGISRTDTERDRDAE